MTASVIPSLSRDLFCMECNGDTKEFFVYIVTNKGRTTLYIGITHSLVRRMWQHRQGEIPGFSKRYNTNRLVYYEQFADVRDAIAREKQLKGWSLKKKKRSSIA